MTSGAVLETGGRNFSGAARSPRVIQWRSASSAPRSCYKSFPISDRARYSAGPGNFRAADMFGRSENLTLCGDLLSQWHGA